MHINFVKVQKQTSSKPGEYFNGHMQFADLHVTVGFVYWNNNLKNNQKFLLSFFLFGLYAVLLFCFLIDDTQIFVNMLPLNQNFVLFPSWKYAQLHELHFKCFFPAEFSLVF